MKNENKSFGSALKGMMLGVAVGSIATMVISNNKTTKKIKKNAKNTAESIATMFKMN
jgi:gas vesicle protein